MASFCTTRRLKAAADSNEIGIFRGDLRYGAKALNTEETQREPARIQRQDTRSYGVHGAMTFDSVTDLWRQSVEIFSSESVVQIDLAKVTHTDSAGLALLVEWLREASRRGGGVEFLNLPAQMLSLAGATNLEPVLARSRNPAIT